MYSKKQWNIGFAELKRLNFPNKRIEKKKNFLYLHGLVVIDLLFYVLPTIFWKSLTRRPFRIIFNNMYWWSKRAIFKNKLWEHSFILLKNSYFYVFPPFIQWVGFNGIYLRLKNSSQTTSQKWRWLDPRINKPHRALCWVVFLYQRNLRLFEFASLFLLVGVFFSPHSTVENRCKFIFLFYLRLYISRHYFCSAMRC